MIKTSLVINLPILFLDNQFIQPKENYIDSGFKLRRQHLALNRRQRLIHICIENNIPATIK